MNTSTTSQFVASKDRVFWGWIFLIFGSIFFLGFLYAAVISKLLPPSGNVIISAIQKDRYYCFLVPLTIPILIVAVYFHWLSMKLFKHAWLFGPCQFRASNLCSYLWKERLPGVFSFWGSVFFFFFFSLYPPLSLDLISSLGMETFLAANRNPIHLSWNSSWTDRLREELVVSIECNALKLSLLEVKTLPSKSNSNLKWLQTLLLQ